MSGRKLCGEGADTAWLGTEECPVESNIVSAIILGFYLTTLPFPSLRLLSSLSQTTRPAMMATPAPRPTPARLARARAAIQSPALPWTSATWQGSVILQMEHAPTPSRCVLLQVHQAMWYVGSEAEGVWQRVVMPSCVGLPLALPPAVAVAGAAKLAGGECAQSSMPMSLRPPPLTATMLCAHCSRTPHPVTTATPAL